MGIRYTILHTLCHLSLALLLSFLLNLSFEGILIALLAQFVIDLDHLVFLKRRNLKESFRRIVEFSKAFNPPLHNFLSLLLSFVGSFLLLKKKFFLVGLFSLSTFLHFLFDFLEDVLIFKMGTEHWKLKFR